MVAIKFFREGQNVCWRNGVIINIGSEFMLWNEMNIVCCLFS